MKYEAMPRLKFEIEGMKSSILAHIGVIGSELGDYLEAEIDKAVNSYPWEEKVKQIVHASISMEIEQYFKYGEGKMSVESAVKEGFSKALGKDA